MNLLQQRYKVPLRGLRTWLEVESAQADFVHLLPQFQLSGSRPPLKNFEPLADNIAWRFAK